MNKTKLWNIALVLAIITIGYNILEGLISVWFGVSDESLSLFGFGLDSFVEVLSGIGILHMILRVKNSQNEETNDRFERRALILTGISFYLLTVTLTLSVIFNIYSGNNPTTTFWGIVISTISIITMTALMKYKKDIGTKLGSEAIIADANCTRTCLYLSVILLVASVLYQLWQIQYIDSLGALAIAYYAFAEGKESFEKAEGKKCSSCCCE